jgi:hypothetical protein
MRETGVLMSPDGALLDIVIDRLAVAGLTKNRRRRGQHRC